MLTAYLHAALQETKTEKMENGHWFLSLPRFPGVWAESELKETATSELEEVLEEWIILGLRRGDSLPVVGDYDLNTVGALE